MSTVYTKQMMGQSLGFTTICLFTVLLNDTVYASKCGECFDDQCMNVTNNQIYFENCRSIVKQTGYPFGSVIVDCFKRNGCIECHRICVVG